MQLKVNGSGAVVKDRAKDRINGSKDLESHLQQPLHPPTASNRRTLSCLSEGYFNSIGFCRGSSKAMGSPSWLADEDKKGRSLVSLNALQRVVMQVVERVRAYGYEDVCVELRDHFARLPARYTFNIDAQRHEDVLLHMHLLQGAREAEALSNSSRISGDPFPIPQVHVRKVQLGSGSPPGDAFKSSALHHHRGIEIPKPAFGSTTNLANMGHGGSPKVHPVGSPFTRSTPPHGTPPLHATPPSRTPPGSTGLPIPIPRPMFGNFSNPLHVDEDALGCYSEHEDASPTYGYEITLATSDRHGLLKSFTSALSNSMLQLNIKEAHVFSTTDGMALEVFVVEGWPGDEAEDLRQAVLLALSNKLDKKSPWDNDAELRAAAEAISYEDWAVDFNQLVVGEKLGNGSSGGLYRGKYLSQDVAIKIIDMDIHSDTRQPVPAAERLQIFKQEVFILRLVRHKNLLQFIGACSCWPKLCIVTELMAGGSVRDLLDVRMGGLDVAAAVKVFRDCARGMDFLHKRGIVHRDLKAANLLIDEQNVVKVCDFGVARLKPSPVRGPDKRKFFWPAEMTAETGTYRWMSPEVLEHKPYDHKADVYSFGITMWEVLTGGVPYAGLSPLQAAIGVVQRGLRPEFPPFLEERLALLAQHCWNHDPRQRPEFSEVLAVLEGMVSSAVSPRKGLFGKKKLPASSSS